MDFLEKSKLSALRTSLTVFLILIITSCASMPHFPEVFFYEIQLDNKVCGKYALVDEKRVLFGHVEDLAWDKCPRILFGLVPQDAASVTDWSRTIIRKGAKCGRK